MKKVKNRSTYSLKWKCDLCTMYNYCNLGHFIWLNPSPSEVPTSGDLKSGDCLFCSTTNIKHRCPHNRKWTQWPQIMTWVWLRTLSEVSHKLQTVKINKIVLAASDENNICSKMPQKASFDWKKKLNFRRAKVQTKALKSSKFNLVTRMGDQEICVVSKMQEIQRTNPLIFTDLIFFYLDSFCLVYKKICLLICPFLLINM